MAVLFLRACQTQVQMFCGLQQHISCGYTLGTLVLWLFRALKRLTLG